MANTTPVEVFTALASKVAANPDWARRVNTIYQITVTGDGGGSWFVDVLGTTLVPSVSLYVPADAAQVLCTITMNSTDFMAIYNNSPGAGLAAFFSGRIVVTGDKPAGARIRMLLAIAK